MTRSTTTPSSALQWDEVQHRLPIRKWKVTRLDCVQYDEFNYNTFFLRYSGRKCLVKRFGLRPVRRLHLQHLRSTLQWGGVQRLLPALQWGEVPSQVKGLRPARRVQVYRLPICEWRVIAFFCTTVGGGTLVKSVLRPARRVQVQHLLSAL